MAAAWFCIKNGLVERSHRSSRPFFISLSYMGSFKFPSSAPPALPLSGASGHMKL
jgi:hypothetical protein